MIFAFTKTSDPVKIDVNKFVEYLNSLKNGVYEIKIKRQESKRSKRQNKYIHGVVCKYISAETGQDPDSVYEFLKLKFNYKIIIIKGIEHKVGKSIAGLSTSRFEEICAKARMWALEDLGITIPKPNEKI